MTRPLMYDDQFVSMISEKVHERFLYFFTIKVQSTAFFQRLNLQRALIISSLVDFLIGLIIFLLFFKILQLKEGNLFFIENVILTMGMVFGIVGLDAALNIKKRNCLIYKYWRIFITFFIPIVEFFNYDEYYFCYYNEICSPVYYYSLSAVYILFNLYLVKIAWSVCIRLGRNEELLVIHGKYLEQMIKEEKYKIHDARKYIPIELRENNARKYRKENEMMNLGVTESGTVKEDTFLPKTTNPFLNAIKKIQNEKL